MSKRLTFEQAKKFVENDVLGRGNNIIKIDIPKFKNREWLIVGYKILEDKQVIYFDLIESNEPMMKDRQNYFVPHTMIKEICNMSIDKILEAYDMGENNRVEEIDIETDVENEVNGKENVVIDGFEFDDGQRYIFLNDVNPKFKNRIFTVRRDENGLLKLIANRGRPKKTAE